MKKGQADKNFWLKLTKPIYALAPMAGVTDSAFRQICKSFGADVVYSEMVSATALAYGSEKTFELMQFSKMERPFVVQLFGAKPEHFMQAVQKIIPPSPFVKGEIDGIDINFGCPVKKVARQGAGAVLMNDLKLARAIVAAVAKNTDLPVSIKIRAKVGETDALKFLRAVKDLPIAAVMIHGRSLKQGQAGEVDWRMIKRARPLVKGVLLANGGVKDWASADELLKKTGADGVGIGQAALGRPWIFEDLRMSNVECRIKNAEEKSPKNIFGIMLKHAELTEKLKGRQGIIEMRKQLCWYVSGMPNAGAIRQELVKAESLKDIKDIFKSQIPISKSQTNSKF